MAESPALNEIPVPFTALPKPRCEEHHVRRDRKDVRGRTIVDALF